MDMEEYAAKLLVDSGVVYVGEFTLTSGRKSDIYIDLRSVLGIPTTFKSIIGLLYAEYNHLLESVDALIGVATGGIAWATALALLTGKAFGYVRARPKEHGLSKSVEGVKPSKKVILIDDVATSGASLLNAAKVLRENGFSIDTAIVIVDREEGARENLSENDIMLLSLTKLSIIRRYILNKPP